MVTPTPVRSGFRVAGQEAPPTVYAHPPLVESWLGVEFADPIQATEADLLKLREKLGPEWPGKWNSVSGNRQLTNVMSDRAIRLTSHGFAFGWQGYSGERYPRYESIRDGFVTVLGAVQSMIGKVRAPQQWSVRYVNRVPQGTVWSTEADWGFFCLWQPTALQKLGVDATGFQAQWEFPLEAERGTLKIEFQHVPTDDSENVWINLTASGPVEDEETGLFDGLDYGREVIVRGFNELVSPEAKTFWGVQTR